MIKYGAHAFLFLDRWSDLGLELMPRVRDLGLQVLEIPVGDDVAWDPRAARNGATECGLDLVLSPGGEWPGHCDLSAEDPSHRAAGLAWHRRNVDLAAEAGAIAYAGALYGHPGTVLRRRPPPEEPARTAEGLHALAEHGARRGVVIVIEPMSHFRTHVVNTPAQAVDLVRRAEHPNLRILLDTYHMVTEVTDYGAAIREVGGLLRGVHACENDRGVPGRGIVPWSAVFDALRGIAFDGYVMLETYNSSIGDFAHTRGMFHDVCPDPDAFVREGLRFLRAGLG